MQQATVDQVRLDGEVYFKISHSDDLRPFFMSIVSDSDHWLFISSNGGLTAGRKNSEFSLFPYYTDDKITESAENTGSKSIFRVLDASGNSHLWEPFSERFDGMYRTTRNLYKSAYGNKILFEEINHDLEMTFRYQWNSSDAYGFVRIARLINHTGQRVGFSMLDGIQNILPYGVGSYLQNQTSNLVDAYKRSELEEDTGLGIYALSAIIVDKAEPSEALKANIVWSLGWEHTPRLLSSLQLKAFREGKPVRSETDVKAEKGAYFIHAEASLEAGEEKEWMIVADVNQNHASIARIMHAIQSEDQLARKVKADIEKGARRLVALNAAADGLQRTADPLRDARHFSNTLFNIMRGGIFDHHYDIDKEDFRTYLLKGNQEAYRRAEPAITGLPEVFSLATLTELAQRLHDRDLQRLCLEYLPLKFSRRHGDPSRPWNRFSINTRAEDGSKILDYEGNWRDIFQNWEALALSFPGFVESMIHKFLNATTFEGYNPYRVTKDGFDWETIEPDDPWSYIGYWGDHQIIYLLKLLELAEQHTPGQLAKYFSDDLFVYANVPYKIKSYHDILKNSKDTIDFDRDLDEEIRHRREEMGADGALLTSRDGSVVRANFMEKILATVLAKLSNFIPEGGIWMNTQRPEWNDANNALVGNGVSMVTLYYLRRFLNFLSSIAADSADTSVPVSAELTECFRRIFDVLEQHQHLLSGSINDRDRKTVLDGLGQAGSDFRWQIYRQAFSGEKQSVPIREVLDFTDLALRYLEHSIRTNRRRDHLYHAYNLMTVEGDDAVSIAHLSEMLEGQVAVLSSGYLSGVETLELLDALKSSALFREDQYSYLLYPAKKLPGFLQKNTVPKGVVQRSALLTRMVEQGDGRILERDLNGVYHFNGNFKNANDLRHALDALAGTDYEQQAASERKDILDAFEQVFNHKAFTGRSGTFYGYEGLGSIYWHMVSKLQLAVQEVCLQAIEEGQTAEVVGRLLEHYYEINAGIGVHKSPALYGAFPTDPYSHTPAGRGAQQPGMTGQVKEDILSRFGELGAFVEEGQLVFNPCLLRKVEFLKEPRTFEYVDIHQQLQTLELAAGTLCFTYCQIPVVYAIAPERYIEVVRRDGSAKRLEGDRLDPALSREVFGRTGAIARIHVAVKEADLR